MNDTPNIYDFEEYARNNPFQLHNHVEMVEVSDDHVRVKVDLVHESTNLHGYVHGGLIYSMADISCGIQCRTQPGHYVTQSCHINSLRNTDHGTIYCDTEVVKRGRSMVIIHFRVTDDEERLLADGVIDYFRR